MGTANRGAKGSAQEHPCRETIVPPDLCTPGLVDDGANSLAELVARYRACKAPEFRSHLKWFSERASIKEAIESACLGREGKLDPHQYRVGRAVLEAAVKKLQQDAKKLSNCDSFESLIEAIKTSTAEINRFGKLAVYDTALRLGQYLKIESEVVYVHAGVRKGCRALGLKVNSGVVSKDRLPRELRRLSAKDVEHFLCIYKDKLNGLGPEPA